MKACQEPFQCETLIRMLARLRQSRPNAEIEADTMPQTRHREDNPSGLRFGYLDLEEVMANPAGWTYSV
ncbi:MAG: hypothetical protein Fues2KO_36670 [Fuerstiella sp.]